MLGRRNVEMIGKIMSKASESIIGMLSAKPITMDNNASKFDFGTH
jgi:hypothetical protein